MLISPNRISALFFAIIWAFILTLTALSGFADYKDRIIVFALIALSFFFLHRLYVVYQTFSGYSSDIDYPRSTHWDRLYLIVFLTSIGVHIIYFIIFFPGLVTWDFYDQWLQVAGKKQFNDWHPVFHTLLVWLLTRIWFSPAIITLFQILCFATLLVMTLHRLKTAMVPKCVLIAVASFYIFYPLNGFYIVSFWKDIAYALSLWWLTLLFFDVVLSRGNSFRSQLFCLKLSLALTFVSLMRHNGLIPAFLGAAVIIIIYRNHTSAIIKTIAAALLLVVFHKAILLQWVNADTSDTVILKAHLPVQHIGAVMNNDGQLINEEQRFFEKFMPLDYWEKAFDYYSCMPLIHGRDKNRRHYLNRELLTSIGPDIGGASVPQTC